MSHSATSRNRLTVVIASAWLIFASLVSTAMAADSQAPFLANGVKIGEITRTRAIVWTRLTKTSAYKTDGVDFSPLVRRQERVDSEIEELGPAHGYGNQVRPGMKLADMNSALPGMAGEVRLVYWSGNGDGGATTVDWTPVDNHRDYTKQFSLTDLTPATKYRFRLEGRPLGGSAPTAAVESEFTTAPPTDRSARIVFTVVTGQRWQTRDDLTNGQKIYPQMAALNPSFFVHTGDIVYYDSGAPFATHIDLARFKWNRSYALPFVRDFHNRVPSYFMKDDHDSWQNDDWPTMDNKKMGQFTWEEGKQLFLEQVPMGRRTYRTIRWGKDLQIWLVEGRDFRSPNDAPDGPDKTIWGAEQMAWFKRTVQACDATFRVLISPTPIVGPDHLWKANTVDNHVAAGRAYEGNRLRQFLSRQDNMYVICGDRHWQYVSEHPQTGVREYSCGPTTDKHATELANDDRTGIQYIKPKGGFLAVTIDRVDGVPSAIFRHHGVDGQIYHEDVRAAK